MKGLERAIVITALLYMAFYIPYFFAQTYRISQGINVSPYAIFPLHFLAMALNFIALIVTIRDLYLRPFVDPNRKLTWLLLILLTGGIGWVVYLFRHALKPRTSPREQSCLDGESGVTRVPPGEKQ
jgi:hypothetical protein